MSTITTQDGTQIQVAASQQAEDHSEWLIDESLEETFPASDPTVPVRPGSTVAERYAQTPAEGELSGGPAPEAVSKNGGRAVGPRP